MTSILCHRADKTFVTLAICPRCQGAHSDLEVHYFQEPVVDPNPIESVDPAIFHAWSLCPLRAEPLLIFDAGLLDPASLWVRRATSREHVEQIAYHLWQLEGEPHGRDALHWLIAEWLLSSPLRQRIDFWMLRVPRMLEEHAGEVRQDVLEQLSVHILRQCPMELVGRTYREILPEGGAL